MTMTKADFQRIADGFAYVVGDPTADRNTVVKVINEFCNAAEARSIRFHRGRFLEACGFDPDPEERGAYQRPDEVTPDEITEILDQGSDSPPCPACGEPIDYCQGHGTLGDSAGAEVLERHDEEDHRQCHPNSWCKADDPEANNRFNRL